jgi:hypothetical protein
VKRSLVVSLLAGLALSGACTHLGQSRTAYGTSVARGSDLREITADSTDAFYRGAFEICRSQTSTGFELVQAPTQYKAQSTWGFTGLVRCTGPIDPALAQRYNEREHTGAHFAFTRGPLTDHTYFEVVKSKRAE